MTTKSANGVQFKSNGVQYDRQSDRHIRDAIRMEGLRVDVQGVVEEGQRAGDQHFRSGSARSRSLVDVRHLVLSVDSTGKKSAVIEAGSRRSYVNVNGDVAFRRRRSD